MREKEEALNISIAKCHKERVVLFVGLFPPQRLQVLRKHCKMEIGFFVLIIWGMIMWTFTVIFTLAATEKGKKKSPRYSMGEEGI